MGRALSDRDSAGAASPDAKHSADADGRRNDVADVDADRGGAGLDQLAATSPEDPRTDPAQGALFVALARAGQAAAEGLGRHEAPLGATAAAAATAATSVCRGDGRHVPHSATAPTTTTAAAAATTQ